MQLSTSFVTFKWILELARLSSVLHLFLVPQCQAQICSSLLTDVVHQPGRWTAHLRVFVSPTALAASPRGWQMRIHFTDFVEGLNVTGAPSVKFVQGHPYNEWLIAYPGKFLQPRDFVTLILTVKYQRSRPGPAINSVTLNDERVCSDAPVRYTMPQAVPLDAGGPCSHLVRMTSTEVGSWKGTVTFLTPESSQGWKLRLRFSNRISKLAVSVVGSTKILVTSSGNDWTVESFGDLRRGGSEISLDVTVSYVNYGVQPQITEIVFNDRLSVCPGTTHHAIEPTIAPVDNESPIYQIKGACSDWYSVTTTYRGEWQGKIRFPSKEATTGWTLEFEFSAYVQHLYVKAWTQAENPGSPQVSSLGGLFWTIKYPDGVLTAGSDFLLQLKVHYSAAFPQINSINFNGRPLCGYGLPGRPNASQPPFVSVPLPDISTNVVQSSTQEPTSTNACGTVASGLSPLPLIFNGSPTSVDHWPWHGALFHVVSRSLEFRCGATLVTLFAAITAGHCVTSDDGSTLHPDKVEIRLGLNTHLWGKGTEDAQMPPIAKIHVPSGYDKDFYTADVAVARFARPVTFTDKVRPACLGYPGDVRGYTGVVVGWGLDENNNFGDKLQMARLPAVHEQTCINSHPEFYEKYKPPRTFCAGYANGTSVCNGDSGGGWLISSGGHWYLRGIVSLGAPDQLLFETTGGKRCDPNYYTIFTDVADYMDFIKSIV